MQGKEKVVASVKALMKTALAKPGTTTTTTTTTTTITTTAIVVLLLFRLLPSTMTDQLDFFSQLKLLQLEKVPPPLLLRLAEV